ncbi:MAG TPA: alpha/beta fold hydrolase [Rhizomicrobium sp.]|nr:alpha/beta fold hydrolase [Rhizomicrobium sp.]
MKQGRFFIRLPVACVRDALIFAAAAIAFTFSTAQDAVTAAAPASTSVATLDPFLVGAGHLGNIGLAAFLAGNPNLGAYAANALSADGASAAIVLFETTSSSSVNFQINSAATLLPYTDNFLTTTPATGQSSVTVSSLIQVGSEYYAPVLVQGPLAGYSQDNTISITATQDATQASGNLALTIPPLVLVHGLWGDRKSLSQAETWLRGHAPWNSAPALVEPICYSKYLRFDAKKDPLSNGNDPCEVTSKASLQTEIDSLMAELDGEQIVGARVDLVVHSMGGLVARNYASQPKYGSLRNRMQGQFHAIVTLNTPETGSLLAPFLIAKRDAKRKAPLWTPQGFIWDAVCGNATVAKCFDANGYPIYAPSLPVNSGAVYSLDPDGPSLNNPNLSGPNIGNATWRAISSTKPGNSALALGLDTLIAALYSNPDGNDVPTVDSVLQDEPNDAIVTVDSQTKGAEGNQLYTFAKLSHTSLVSSILTWLTGDNINDNSVTDDPSNSVDKLAACWVETTGSDSCLGLRDLIAPGAEATLTGPRMLKPVDRLAVRGPTRVTLGRPFEVTIRVPRSGLRPQIAVYQVGETGRVKPEEVTATGANGELHIRIAPKLLGPVSFGVRAVFADGGVSVRTLHAFVAPPAAPPLLFRANDLPVLVLTRDADTATAMPHPAVLYAAPIGWLDLNARFVTWTLVPQPGAPTIRVDPNGLIHALAPGDASAEAHFGSATADLRVIVRQTQQ